MIKVGLHTVDLIPGRERLMPYRTVLEVAREMISNGWDAYVLNSSVSEGDTEDFVWEGVRIVQCPREFSMLSRWVNERCFDAFFFAATIREGLRSLSGFRNMTSRKIAYVPSGITHKQNAWWLYRLYGMYAIPWLLEAFTPKLLLGLKLKKAGFTDVIGLTNYTTQRIGNTVKVHSIYPGKDDFEKIELDESVLRSRGLKGKKFFLFTGGPAEVRGSLILIKAFDEMVKDVPNAQLVVLMRHDVGAGTKKFQETYRAIKHKENIIVLDEFLTRPQLKAFMKESYALVLPFVCIPAEIPLTYYEALSCGTPIISFKNGGTTEYLHGGLMLCHQTSQAGLTSALETLWYSPKLRNNLSQKAKEIMCAHPTWSHVGKEWMNILNEES